MRTAGRSSGASRRRPRGWPRRSRLRWHGAFSPKLGAGGRLVLRNGPGASPARKCALAHMRALPAAVG
eukprot:833422-Pyramimonas_sp.AAC.1